MIIDILLGVIAYLLALKGKFGVSGWIVALLMLKYLRDTEKRKYDSESYLYYPQNDLIKPTKYKFLFKETNLPSQGIPKEWYYFRIISFWVFCIATAIGAIISSISQRATFIVFISYIVFVGLTCMISVHLQTQKSFYSKFKKLTVFNFIYWLIGGNYPVTKRKGKCKIISEYQKGKDTYVTVQMIEGGEIKEKVLLCGKKKQGKAPVYSLYEICRVFYIL